MDTQIAVAVEALEAEIEGAGAVEEEAEVGFRHHMALQIRF